MSAILLQPNPNSVPAVAIVEIISDGKNGMDGGVYKRQVLCDPDNFKAINGAKVNILPSGVPMMIQRPKETTRLLKPMGLTEVVWGASKLTKRKGFRWQDSPVWNVCRESYADSSVKRIDEIIAKRQATRAERERQLKLDLEQKRAAAFTEPAIDTTTVDPKKVVAAKKLGRPRNEPVISKPTTTEDPVVIIGNGYEIRATPSAINAIDTERLKIICGK